MKDVKSFFSSNQCIYEEIYHIKSMLIKNVVSEKKYNLIMNRKNYYSIGINDPKFPPKDCCLYIIYRKIIEHEPSLYHVDFIPNDKNDSGDNIIFTIIARYSPIRSIHSSLKNSQRVVLSNRFTSKISYSSSTLGSTLTSKINGTIETCTILVKSNISINENLDN